MYCPKCGYKNPDEAVYCMKCGKRIPVSDEALDPATVKAKKKSKTKGILFFFAIFLIGPIMILLAFVYPQGIGYVWILGMVFTAVKMQGVGRNWWAPAAVLIFLAFMGTVTDMHGNPGNNYLVKYIHCEENDELVIEKHVSHPQPGETNISYYKYCKKPNGGELKLTGWRNLTTNLIYYFGIAFILFMFNQVFQYWMSSRKPFHPLPPNP